MKRNSPILFFTLLDFFLVVIFFGFLLYALSVLEAKAPDTSPNGPIENHGPDTSDLENIIILTGHFKTSNFSKLTDQLVTMIPADFQKWEESKREIPGVGKPHCLARKNNPRSAIILASVMANEGHITFTEETSNLTDVLQELGLKYEEVESLSLEQFVEAFAQILTTWPSCRYTLEVVETTDRTKPRDAIEKLFYRKAK